MKNVHHILNGDTLKEQFPKKITGEIIVARECLVEGDVFGKDLEALLKTRAKYISNTYPEHSQNDYYSNTASELKKIESIPKDTEVNLWFEDDLFCQVNFWFVINLIGQDYNNQSIFLIRPKKGSEYSFGQMNELELVTAFQEKMEIVPSEIKQISKLWLLYQNDNHEKMLGVAKKLEIKFPFLTPAIKAHIDRKPTDGKLGRPTQSLINIMTALKTKEFEPVFIEFCKREGIYGFGDSQVKNIFDKIILA